MYKEKRISIAVIRRLPRYYRYLGDLLDNGITRISSKELSVRMNITASQIRQDLNNFGKFGQQGYGYNVESLYEEIRTILGLGKPHDIVIVGAGKIGQAIVNYKHFERRGFKFVKIFDKNEAIVGNKINGTSIDHISNLRAYIDEHKIDFLALTVPYEACDEVMELIKGSSIRGIWNFSPVDLELPDGMIVENVHLTDSLMTLSYKLNEDSILGEYGPKK